MSFAIGVDLGGTNIRVALVDDLGNIVKSLKESTCKDGIEGIVKQIKKMYDKLEVKENVLGLGIGVPGPVNKDGVVSHLPNLNIFSPFDFKQMLEKELNLKVFVGNDANVASLAEAMVGNGKGYDVCQYITLSTGIGGGLIINKKMITGTFGYAQEIGAMIINVNGNTCPSKPNGCIEAEASGTALVNKAKKAGLQVENAGDVFKLATLNDPKAVSIKKEFITYLSSIMASIVSYIEPNVFVLGGGLMKSQEYFLDELKEAFNNLLYPALKGKIAIVKAKYDQDCGIIGAAMQVFNSNE